MLNALKADPRTVDLRALAACFYEGAVRVLELFEEDDDEEEGGGGGGAGGGGGGGVGEVVAKVRDEGRGKRGCFLFFF